MFQDIAQRMVNAENGFIESVMNCGKCSKEDAEKVFNLYRKEKLVKLHAGIGRYTVTHGALLDYDVIQRAINA